MLRSIVISVAVIFTCVGIGLIAAVPADKFKRVKSLLERANEKFYVIGRTVKGDRKVIYQ